jgi:hypothetical protein
MYMELVFNIYEEIDPVLRSMATLTGRSNYRDAKKGLQSLLKLFETHLEYTTLNYWPHDVAAAFMRQIFYYTNAFWLNMLFSNKAMCAKNVAKELQAWLGDVDHWVMGEKHMMVRDCAKEFAPFRQALALLLADKAALAKEGDAAREHFMELRPAQARVLLKQMPDQGEAPARLLRAFGPQDEDEAQDVTLDKTKMFPIPIKSLHALSLAEVTSVPFPPTVSRMLADEMARSDLIDDEYVVVDFDLSKFEIGDEMDNLELEQTDSVWEGAEEETTMLDEEMRSQLMLGQVGVTALMCLRFV